MVFGVNEFNLKLHNYRTTMALNGKIRFVTMRGQAHCLYSILSPVTKYRFDTDLRVIHLNSCYNDDYTVANIGCSIVQDQV